MSHWADHARATIDRVHRSLPADVSFKDRKAAVDAAYPFGQRAYSPYKTWLRARKAYLAAYDPKTPAPLFDGWPRDPVTGRPVIT